MRVAGRSRVRGAVTMGRGSETNRRFSQLPVQRFCLRIISAIATATRWAVFEPGTRDLGRRVRGQVQTYLSCLADLGAFASESYIVECDAAARGVTILLVFQPIACDEPVSLTLHQTASGCRVGSTAFAPSLT